MNARKKYPKGLLKFLFAISKYTNLLYILCQGNSFVTGSQLFQNKVAVIYEVDKNSSQGPIYK